MLSLSRNLVHQLLFKNPARCILRSIISQRQISQSVKPSEVADSANLSSFSSEQPNFSIIAFNPRGTFNSTYAACFRHSWVTFYSTRAYIGPISRSLRRRISKRAKAAAKPVLNQALFQAAKSQLSPRFTNEELHDLMVSIDDPLVCFELFNWASQQHRFRHDALTYHITVRKLGAAKMYEEMDVIVNQVLAVPSMGSEPLFNSMIYYFTEARKMVRAVNIYKHMHGSKKLDCRPSIRTYNILFAAFLNRGKNSYINYLYMESVRSLFKQMIDDGVEPDVFCLNCMIKGVGLKMRENFVMR